MVHAQFVERDLAPEEGNDAQIRPDVIGVEIGRR